MSLRGSDHLLTAAQAAEWDRKMAVDDAYRRGAEAMRNRCANIVDCALDRMAALHSIRALNLNETADS